MRGITLVIVASLGTRAYADDATAKALFDEGKTLMAEGKYGDACKKLEASYRMNRLSGTGGMLGLCFEKIGRFASAWSAYRDSAAIAERQGNAERAAVARQSAKDLEPKLAWLTLDARAALTTPGVTITIDGSELPVAALGSPIPVDSGPHVLAATAFDYKRWQQTIEIDDAEKQAVTIPALVEDPTRRLALEARQREIDKLVRRRKTIAYSLTGGGVAALGVAAGFGLSARGQWNDAKAAGCVATGQCPDDRSKQLGESAATRANVATAAGIAGLVMIGAGIAVYVTAPSSRVLEGPRITPAITPTSAGVALEGRF